MGILKNRKRKENFDEPVSAAVQTGSIVRHPFPSLCSYTPLAGRNGEVYRMLREGVPIIDSAVNKIVRLIGGFRFSTGDEETDRRMNEFFSMINVGGNQVGINAFTDTFCDQLLTYGTAIGELIYDENGFYALYNGELKNVEMKRADNYIGIDFYNTSAGAPVLIEHPEKLLFCVLNPEPSSLEGTSLLRGLPFISDILLKIFTSIGTNWERAGNLRFAVTYNPQGDGSDSAFAKERAKQMAEAWREAMSSKECVKDFVAVGDVKVSVIGADNQILDSEVPVRQLLEQIIAKTGLMPYMFGLNWSTSERMAQQQTDILTTELEAYRRTLEPTLKKIGNTYLVLNGMAPNVSIEWDEITLQDETELATARYYNAQAQQIETGAENE